ncbi:MAG TPA: response regulator transcription factor [Myxococcaceae bacterium]|nr:response regulator transcription factor [Myxococcaceae bacterium]
MTVEAEHTVGVRVSVFDPQSLVRDSLVRALKTAGIPVVGESSNLNQFLASLASDRPDVAIVDMAGVGSTGLTLLKEAHQFHPEIHLLVLLGSADPASVDRCLEAGAAGYLDKSSAGCDAMIDAVRAVRRGDRVFPALFLETFVRARTDPGPTPGALHALSTRERQVLAHLAGGADNATIADSLGISERTVKAHVSHLYRKLSQKNRTQLALMARQLGVRPAVEGGAAEVPSIATGEP